METNTQMQLFSQPDSHAKTFQLAESVKVCTVKDRAYGLNLSVLFAEYDHVSFSLKTSQHCWLEAETKFYLALPPSGMMLNGKCYQQKIKAHGIQESACSLLPTPTASDWLRASFSKDSIRKNVVERGHQLQLTALMTLTDVPIQVWPKIWEWLMGFPLNWTDLKPSETQ